jgi:hypothetical protein
MNQDKKPNEGHTREWQDRARVVLDAKENAKTEASPNQSPVAGEDIEDVEERSKDFGSPEQDGDPVY